MAHPSTPKTDQLPSSGRLFRRSVAAAVLVSVVLLTLHQVYHLDRVSAAVLQKAESSVRHLSIHVKASDKTDIQLDGVVQSQWPYTCWTPEAGLSSPSLTIATVMGGMPDSYVTALRRNRLHFCSQHGYRYCELSGIDKHRIPAWSKLPWMLALLPCTQHVLHLDADAMLSNMSLNFLPWMQFMEKEGVDQLFSADIIPESAINYGVFMIRRAEWVWHFYKRLYNLCTCAWGRTHDWPAEQGLVYDLLAQDVHSPETRRSRIIPGDGWNRIVNNGAPPGPKDVVIHLVYPTRFAPGSACAKQKEFTRACKYEGMTYYLTQIIGQGQGAHKPMDVHMVSNHTCQPVRSTKLFNAKETYSSDGDALSSSVLEFDVDPETGSVKGVVVGEVGCVGYRERTCSQPDLWNRTAGTGPWPRWSGTVI